MRIVFKIGSNVLMGNKDALDLDLMKGLIQEMSSLHYQGWEVVIVTSGAVATGRAYFKSENILRPIAAAIGQAELIREYIDLFDPTKVKVAQILLSPNAFKNRDRYEYLKKTIQGLIERHVIPIINENDVTTLQDTFGDNDSLAAMVSVITGADRLIFLTNLNGLYNADPKVDKNAQIIKEVHSVDLEIQKMCSQKKSSLGRGGMLSKLKGANLATTCGIETYIINGLQPDNIRKLLLENQSMGTKFIVEQIQLSERKKWLLIGSEIGRASCRERV